MTTEAVYQRKLINKLEKRFPGCFILKTDPSERQGLPDLLVLFQRTWAMLEVKLDSDFLTEPNQQYYISHFDNMSFASFIYPEIEAEVLDDLQQTFRSFG